jgi:hypothetical protein
MNTTTSSSSNDPSPYGLWASVIVTLSFAWNVVQAVFFLKQNLFTPPEHRDNFNGKYQLLMEQIYSLSLDIKKCGTENAVRIQNMMDSLRRSHRKKSSD